MAEQSSLVQDGWDRVSAAYESIQEEAQRLQKQLNTRRKALEKQLSTSRRSIEKRTRKQVNQLRGELSRNDWLKRVQELQSDVGKQLANGVGTLLGAFQIASKHDVERIDRRLSQLNKKLKDLERIRRTNGQGPASSD